MTNVPSDRRHVLVGEPADFSAQRFGLAGRKHFVKELRLKALGRWLKFDWLGVSGIHG